MKQNKMADRQEVSTYVKKLLKSYTHQSNILDTDDLIRDLNLSQLNLVDLVFTVEAEFNFHIEPDGFYVNTVGELIDLIVKRSGRKREKHLDRTESSSVEDFVKSQLCELSGVDEENITPALSLRRDLGIDSLDEINLILTCEKQFKIAADDSDIDKLQNVGDLIEYMKQKCAQTEEQSKASKVEKPSSSRPTTKQEMIIRYVSIIGNVSEKDISPATKLEEDLYLDANDMKSIVDWCAENLQMDIPAPEKIATVEDILNLL